jgi:hypothetical protein
MAPGRGCGFWERVWLLGVKMAPERSKAAEEAHFSS